MAKKKKTKTHLNIIDDAVEHYKHHRTDFDHLGRTMLMHLTEDEILRKLIHSGKFRSKEPDHLKDKLLRKESEYLKKGSRPKITKNNLFDQIHDLVGVRLLHLHTYQMEEISVRIDELLELNNYTVIEDPVVYIWDIEHKEYFEGLGITPIERPEMYTSVHYVVASANRPELRIELQVRTLMEEVWGEVSHTVNYPHPTDIRSCQEQLKVLARITSGCTRLVDSIFNTRDDLEGK